MDKNYTPDNLFEALKTIIDLPDEVVSLKLSIEPNNFPIMEIETYIKYADNHRPIFEGLTEIKRFKLVEIEDD